MDGNKRSRLGFGILLILLGALFAAFQVVPGLQEMVLSHFDWPLIIVAVGAFLLLMGFLVGAPDMAVPACIVAGTGGILYYQNMTGDWASWSYAWALYPGFIGIGMLIASPFKQHSGRAAMEGVNSLLLSAVLFLIFGSLLGNLDLLGPYWPLLLVGAGLYMIVRSFFRSKSE